MSELQAAHRAGRVLAAAERYREASEARDAARGEVDEANAAWWGPVPITLDPEDFDAAYAAWCSAHEAYERAADARAAASEALLAAARGER